MLVDYLVPFVDESMLFVVPDFDFSWSKLRLLKFYCLVLFAEGIFT